MNITPKQAKRFWTYVDIRGPDECWLWTGHPHCPEGYGQYKVGSTKDGSRRNAGAHVVSCTLIHGPVPTGLMVKHSCDVKRCCNPKHLSIGTCSENHKEAWARGLKQGTLLDYDDVIAIRAAEGSNKDIAAQFNLDRRYVWAIRSNKCWMREAA